MPFAIADGINTRYELVGSGPPLLMFSPGGFDATLDKWRTQGIYANIKPLDHLSRHFTCIVFDRRECGDSGGRVEAVTWAHYVAQAKGLLEHLRIPRAHLMGACMGCSPAIAFAAAHPDKTASVVLYWPVGGAHYHISSHTRFNEHLAFVEGHGLEAVAALAEASGKPFNQDTRGGPWASVLRHDADFRRRYAAEDAVAYRALVASMRDGLFDRDTAPGVDTQTLFTIMAPTFVVPGKDKTHATSAARYLEECLPHAEYWDVTVADQTEEAVSSRLLDFLARKPIH